MGRSWTDDDLAIAVARSLNLTQAIQALGLRKGGGTWVAVRGRIEELGLDTSHWAVVSVKRQEERLAARRVKDGKRPQRDRTWTDEELSAAVAKVFSIAGVIRELGLKVGGGAYVAMHRHIERLGLDTSHFTGQGWCKDRRDPPVGKSRPLEEILVRDSDFTTTSWLRVRLLKEGVKDHRCEACGRSEWEGKAIPLQLDHINGDRTDNRLENLRLLCPNCHAQTDTWCGKNIGRARGYTQG